MNKLIDKRTLIPKQQKVRDYFYFAHPAKKAFDRSRCYDYGQLLVQDYNEKKIIDIKQKDDAHEDRRNHAILHMHTYDYEREDENLSSRRDIVDFDNRPAFERYKFIDMNPHFVHIFTGLIFSMPFLMVSLFLKMGKPSGDAMLTVSVFALLYVFGLGLLGTHKAFVDYSHPSKSSSILFYFTLIGLIILGLVIR